MTLEVKLRFSGVKCSLCSVSVCVCSSLVPHGGKISGKKEERILLAVFHQKGPDIVTLITLDLQSEHEAHDFR